MTIIDDIYTSPLGLFKARLRPLAFSSPHWEALGTGSSTFSPGETRARDMAGSSGGRSVPSRRGRAAGVGCYRRPRRAPLRPAVMESLLRPAGRPCGSNGGPARSVLGRVDKESGLSVLASLFVFLFV